MEDRWPLSAPESYVLRHGAGAPAADVLKLALLELVARDALSVHRPVRRLLGRSLLGPPQLLPGRALVPGHSALAPVAALVRDEAREVRVTGVRVDKVARAARRRWRRGYGDEVVVPALVARGLMAREERRRLGLFRSLRIVRTAAGDLWRRRLEELLHRLRDLGASPDRQEALALVTLAGAAVLLARDAWPLLADLQQRAVDTGAGGGAGDGGDWPDPEGLDLGGLDPAVFDALGDAFDAIDSGVDSGDGGDGGGGGD